MNSPAAYSTIVATGRAVPESVVTNEQVEKDCRLEPGWIRQRTGILQRPVVEPHQAVSDLAISAGQIAVGKFSHRVDLPAISMLILATSTPDYLLPPTGPFVADQLGLGTIPAFDMAVACSGFLYALQMADGFCRTQHGSVLIIAANVLSKRVTPEDPATAAIFADGAGAVVLSPSSEAGIRGFRLESDGSGFDCLKIPDGGSKTAFHAGSLAENNHKMKINDGMAVFRYAVESMAKLGQAVLHDCGVPVEDVDYWLPHQANLRIIESARQRLGIAKEKTGVTIDRFANSSAATIPIALDYFLDSQTISPGQQILMTTAAAGLTSGAALVRLPRDLNSPENE